MAERRPRPAPLLFEPSAPEESVPRFFGLEDIDDPAELLARAGELVAAFRTATERAAGYQAMAAAELADPARFDRWTVEELAAVADVPVPEAERMLATGRRLLAEGFTVERYDGEDS